MAPMVPRMVARAAEPRARARVPMIISLSSGVVKRVT